jgi:hypothetical protein
MTRDPIDDLVEGHAPVPDDGFTNRVMAALPPPHRASWSLDLWLPWLGAGMAAAVLAQDATSTLRSLPAGLAALGGGLAQAIASSWPGGVPPNEAALLAAALALGAATLGTWRLAEPS